MRLMSVVGVHPETYTVDVEDWRSGWRMMGVPVMTGPATGRTGLADLPEFSAEHPGVAVVDDIDGAPVVMGFLHNRTSRLRFEDGRALYRHGSGVYWSCTRTGDLEIHHPSGAYFRIGESAAHEDLSGQDADGVWQEDVNTGRSVTLRMAVGAAHIDIAPSGAITLATGSSSITLSPTGIVLAAPALDINKV